MITGMDARPAIYGWSQIQPSWRQDLLRRVSIGDADDQACREVLDLLLKENGLAPAAPTPKPLELADLPEDVVAVPQVLLEIGDCSHVNAIDSKESLTFEASGITLIYGENGAGKSSYARIIKRIARAAHEESVLSNVFLSPASAVPRVVIDVEDGNGRTKHIVPLDRRQLLLGSMTVFDGQCANVYLRAEKTVEFTPTPLQIFGRAAAAQRRIRDLLDERVATLETQQPSFEFAGPTTVVRATLNSLSSNFTKQQLRSLATLTDEETSSLRSLRLELAAAEAGTATTEARQRERDAAALDVLATQLEVIAAALSPAQHSLLKAGRERHGVAEETVKVARTSAFASEPLPTTGGEGWIGMWEAARAFVEKDCGHDFPPIGEGGICPLCQQELSVDARARFGRFETFVKGVVEQELASSRDDLDAILRTLAADELAAAAMSPTLAALDETDKLVETVRTWLEVAQNRAAAFTAAADSAPSLDPSPSTAVRELAGKRRAEAERHRQSAESSNQDETRKTVAELEARVQLNAHLAKVLEWHDTVATLEALKGLRSQLDTTSLSTKQTELAKALITDRLRNAVRNELDALGFGHLKVDMTCRTELGQTLARIGLDGATQPLTNVLSAGEQSACALAFFLAEALSSPSEGGIVFDDPASSLDIDRVEHICGRLVELARKRKQLIIFTHNLVLAWFLQAAADRKGVAVAVRPLARFGDKVGIVRTGMPWPGEKLKPRLGRLRQTLQTLEAYSTKGEFDKYELAAKTFASDLRETWERAVEEELFKGVVMRFQRDVKTTHIRDLNITTALTEEVFDGMTETSPYHHAAALAKPVPLPTIDQLRKFFDRLEKFCEAVKQKPAAEAQSRAAGQVPAA